MTAGGWVARFADLAGEILRRPARLGPLRLVAVDGPAGAGKTTFAMRLARELRRGGPGTGRRPCRVEVVHTDDLLDGWADQFSFWGRLTAGVLVPLRQGHGVRHPLYDWTAGRFTGNREFPAPEVLILEGVSSARASARPLTTLAVFVTANEDVCWERSLRRDGAAIAVPLRRWRAAERTHFAQDGTRTAVDLVVDGDPVLAYDPATEFVGLAGDPVVRHSIAGMNEAELRTAVTRVLPGVREDLVRLARIPGIAFDGFDHTVVDRSAHAVSELLRDAGLPDVRIVRSGGQPAVIGRRPAPPGAPTVLLYAHHDVQPTGDPAQWRTDPFEPVEIDGRLYGRGCADDKAGVLAHVAALRAFGDALPVGVIVFVEGEEEFGSASLADLLHEYHDDLAADVIVIADSANWAVGTPALTTSLRGLVNLYVEVATLDHALHSGMYGGVAPDALTCLCRLLATLHDEAGDVAVTGLTRAGAAELDYPVDRFRTESGLLDGVRPTGTGRLVERLWARPAISVLGIDAPPAGQAPNALLPTARAKVSVRLAPGDDPSRAYEAMKKHLEANAPWGARVSVALEQSGAPCVVPTEGPAVDAARAALRAAWDGVEPVEIGIGGSIPFIATFQDLFPAATVLVTGVEDPDSRAHGANESLHLGEFARACLAEALLLANVATMVPATIGRPANGRPR